MSIYFLPEIRLAEDVAAAILDCSDDEECDVVVIPPENHAISDEEAVDEENLDVMESRPNEICGTFELHSSKLLCFFHDILCDVGYISTVHLQVVTYSVN